jgi:hypothetical protein
MKLAGRGHRLSQGQYTRSAAGLGLPPEPRPCSLCGVVRLQSFERSTIIPAPHVVSGEQFARLVKPLIGLPVSDTWRGGGSAIFLELGKLKRPQKDRQPRGEAHIMIQWSWRIESPRAILLGSWSLERKITNGVKALIRRRVTGIALVDRLPEVSISLAGGRWVQSFMTEKGQPEWTVFLHDGSWLCVERGRVIHDGDYLWRRR